VGVSDVASVRWCPMKAVLKSRAEELMFFSAYLHDRLVYGHLLGLIRDRSARTESLAPHCLGEAVLNEGRCNGSTPVDAAAVDVLKHLVGPAEEKP
jgi:hypothetical protein